MVRLKMKRWVYLISILSVLAVVAIFATAAVPVEAQENEVTSIKPGGTYHVYFTVKKPAGMALTGNWEVRIYFYNGLNCYNTAPSGNDDGWWNPSGDTWLYTGYWDHRTATRNVSWSSPDEKEWGQWVPIIHYPAENGNHEARYPPSVPDYENKMGEIPLGQTVSIRARLELRNLANVSLDSTNSTVTFKYGGKTYRCAYSISTYGDIRLDDLGATMSQSEGTGEWTLRFDQNTAVFVDENAPDTGKITIPGTIDFSMLSNYIADGGGIPLWMIIVAIVVVIVVVVIGVLAVKVRGAPKVSP